MERERHEIQKNNSIIPKSFGNKIEVIQSNVSMVEQGVNGEIKIIQKNTSTVRKKPNTPEIRKVQEVRGRQPEITKQGTGNLLENAENIPAEEIQIELPPLIAVSTPKQGENTPAEDIQIEVPPLTAVSTPKQAENTPVENSQLGVPPVKISSIPDRIFFSLDTMAGKIKAQAASQFYKTRLLELISRVKQFLESGKIPEAMAVLTVISDELEYYQETSSGGKAPQVRRNLVEVERALIGIL